MAYKFKLPEIEAKVTNGKLYTPLLPLSAVFEVFRVFLIPKIM
jgi:hypothetical protein